MVEQKGKTLTELLQGSSNAPTKNKAQFQKISEVVGEGRPWKIQMEGEFKSGKSRFALSVLKHLYIEEGLKPEEIKFIIIDLDNGVVPLIGQGLVPPELIQSNSIEYMMCTDFSEVLEATAEAFNILEEHKKKYGLKGCWLMIDNMGMAWEWARDYFSRIVYGKPMQELLIEAKKRALNNAAQKGKTSGRIPGNPFDQMTDYAIINPLHNDWAESIKNSGYNFIWTALLKYEEIEAAGNQHIRVVKPEGQKHNSARVDFILRKVIEDDVYLGLMVGSRQTSGKFAQVKDMDFTAFIRELNKIKDRESTIRARKWDEISAGRTDKKDAPVTIKGPENEETKEIVEETPKAEEKSETVITENKSSNDDDW
jgi:hypothetical protein